MHICLTYVTFAFFEEGEMASDCCIKHAIFIRSMHLIGIDFINLKLNLNMFSDEINHNFRDVLQKIAIIRINQWLKNIKFAYTLLALTFPKP